MPYIDKIVDAINTGLSSGNLSRKAFQQGRYYSLAKQVSVTRGEGNSLRPFIYAINGKKEIDPFIDDTHSFQIYHRCNAIDYSYAVGSQFGDGNQIITERSSMVAVVFGDPERLAITQEDLSFLIVTGFPTNLGSIELGNTNLGQINVIVTGVNHNSLQVFTGEYGSGNYVLKPQSIYFSISYVIETNSDRGCLSCSDC